MDFFAKHGPGAESIADPDRTLFGSFGLGRGGFRELFAPRVFAAGWRALRAGHSIGRPHGDPLQMSGWFLIDGRGSEPRLLWSQVHEHAGSERDLAGMRNAYERATSGGR